MTTKNDSEALPKSSPEETPELCPYWHQVASDFARLDESIIIDVYPENLRELIQSSARNHCGRQDDHVEVLLFDSSFVRILKSDFDRLPVTSYVGWPASNVLDSFTF